MVAIQRSMDRRQDANGASKAPKVDLDLDAVVIGAGFAGVALLAKLRKEGFNVKLVEAGSGLGGVWHWNNYPGARVDSEVPVYALDVPEVYKTWKWTEKYPGAAELQKYFEHVDKVMDISKDTLYNTRVGKATWDDSAHKWVVDCDNGTRITARFMHCCLGFAAKRYFPEWPGLEDFQGFICHSSFWPVEGVDMKGKKMGVVGQGATGIQIAQTAAREVDELTVFVRTPNQCIPMNQGKVDPEKAKKDLESLGDILGRQREENFGGFLITGENKGVFDDDKEARDKVLNGALDYGGFSILFTYNDILTDVKANRYVYDVLTERARARMSNPVKRDILLPVEPVHAFAGKRPSLEQDYYEQMDKDHVKLISLKENPVSHVVSNGVVTKDGQLHELDILAIATGFDSVTGCLMEIDIEGIGGEKLNTKWSGERGAISYLGLAVHGFPNMFFTYGPHAPTAYSNGPTTCQVQVDWIRDVSLRMRDEGKTKIDATRDAEEGWKTLVNTIHSYTLRHNVDSWYMGTNIPGKVRQVLNYAGGIPEYRKAIFGSLEKDFEGFEVS